MKDEAQPVPPVVVHIEEAKLLEMFRTVKSNDLTQANFEYQKTERIKALCGALASVASMDKSESGYGNDSPRGQVLAHLANEMRSVYPQNPIL